MTNDVSIHIVNPDSVILKLIHDAQSLKGQYDSFSIFVDKHDDVKCCVDLDEVIEKHTATIDHPMWFVATDKGMLRMVTDTNFEAEYIREAK